MAAAAGLGRDAGGGDRPRRVVVVADVPDSSGGRRRPDLVDVGADVPW